MAESKDWSWTSFLPGAVRPLEESEDMKKLRKQLESRPYRKSRRYSRPATLAPTEPRHVPVSDEDSSSSDSYSDSGDSSGWFTLGSDTTTSLDEAGRGTSKQEYQLILHKPNAVDKNKTGIDALLSLMEKKEQKTRHFPTYFVSRGLPQPPSMTEDEDPFPDLPRPPSLVYKYEYHVVSYDE